MVGWGRVVLCALRSQSPSNGSDGRSLRRTARCNGGQVLVHGDFERVRRPIRACSRYRLWHDLTVP
eukprot:4740818-Pyramimonas_sp.AAC.1